MDHGAAKMALCAVAKQNGIPVEAVIREIDLCIHTAMHSPDPAVRAQWERIPRQGTVPTAVEIVAYLAERAGTFGKPL